MRPISFKRHRFPSPMILWAVRLYFRFTLSIRDVEELMAERGIEVSREAIRCWVIKFGPMIAANLRRRRSAPTSRWHLDEVIAKIGGKTPPALRPAALVATSVQEVTAGQWSS